MSEEWRKRENSCPGCGFRYYQTIEKFVNDLKEVYSLKGVSTKLGIKTLQEKWEKELKK